MGKTKFRTLYFQLTYVPKLFLESKIKKKLGYFSRKAKKKLFYTETAFSTKAILTKDDFQPKYAYAGACTYF